MTFSIGHEDTDTSSCVQFKPIPPRVLCPARAVSRHPRSLAQSKPVRRLENAVANELKHAAVILIRFGLGYDIDSPPQRSVHIVRCNRWSVR